MKVNIVPHNSNWPLDFENEKQILKQILGDPIPEIEHIGSTSVPNLAAKPIIDIMIGFEDEQALNASVDLMLAAGYLYFSLWEDVMPERRFFVKIKKSAKDLGIPQNITKEVPYPEFDIELRSHHIHMTTKDKLFWKRHLLFRDHLRENEKDRNEYQDLKHNLSKKEWKSGTDYAGAKSEFIQSIEKNLLTKEPINDGI